MEQTILIIEDNPHILRLNRSVFAANGYRVLEAETLEEGHSLLKCESIKQGIVLSNDMMANQKAVNKALAAGNPIIFLLNGINDSVQLDSVTIEALVNANQPINIVLGSFSITFYPDRLKKMAERNDNKVGITVKPLDAGVFGGSNSIIGKMFDIITTGDGSGTSPIIITISLNGLNLKNEDIRKLSGFRLKDDNTFSRLGGNYNSKNREFSFRTDRTSIYGIMTTNDLTSLYMTLGSSLYSLNGNEYGFDTVPIIENDRLLVPVRLIAEAFGAKVSWDESTRTVSILLEGKLLKMKIGEVMKGMDVPPKIISDRTMVPIRFISEYYDANVIYDKSKKAIAIYR